MSLTTNKVIERKEAEEARVRKYFDSHKCKYDEEGKCLEGCESMRVFYQIYG